MLQRSLPGAPTPGVRAAGPNHPLQEVEVPAIAAADAMIAQYPYVSRPRPRTIGKRRCGVFVRLALAVQENLELTGAHISVDD